MQRTVIRTDLASNEKQTASLEDALDLRKAFMRKSTEEANERIKKRRTEVDKFKTRGSVPPTSTSKSEPFHDCCGRNHRDRRRHTMHSQGTTCSKSVVQLMSQRGKLKE